MRRRRGVVELCRDAGERRPRGGRCASPPHREGEIDDHDVPLRGCRVLIVSLAGASFALASGGHKNKGSEFHAKLIGYNEVPSLNTTGHATLDLTVIDTTITFNSTTPT